MSSFLQQVAHHYLEAQGLENYCFVFPNRRSGQFFVHYLQQQLASASRVPHLLPCATSINEFVAELTRTAAATDIEMMFALYDAYCQAMGDKAQEFDKFIYWAQLIISDFNDIDRSLADAREIYQNLEDLHDLSSNYLSPEVKEKVKKIFGDDLFTAFFDTDADASLWRMIEDKQPDDVTDEDGIKQRFLSLWNALETIYHAYHQALEAKGVITSGRQLRMAAESAVVPSRYSRVVFVGFGVLSAAEVKLFDRFKAEGKADFWWDNAGILTMPDGAPRDPGALLIDGYCKRFGTQELEPLEAVEQTVRVVSVPSNVGQAKQAFDEVSRMLDGRGLPGIETAIVLPDEGLLVPLLHSVHAPKQNMGAGMRLNVTLGYPLRSSGIVSLMHIVARMHHQASKDRDMWTYYREDVNDILSHPLIKTYFTNEALDIATNLARTNRFRVPAPELEKLSFGDLFVPAMDSDSPGDDSTRQTDYLDHLLSFSNLLMDRMKPADEELDEERVEELNKDGVEVPLQQAFLMMYIDVLNQLKRSLAECGQTLQRSTVFYLIDRLTAAAVVPFTGEPLQGLQVMGLLETRSLDFENVVILSMNERVFPRRRSVNSFIPNYIRRAHGMSTIEQQEAIVAYNFYRLLNRARRVTLIYDSSAQKIGSSEPSRYITQLEKVYGKQLEFIELSTDVETSSPIAIEVSSADAGNLRSRYTSDPATAGGRFLSASAINKYINCPLSFYLHYVQGLNEDNEVSDFMDYGTFGDIIHDTLSSCYYCEQSMARGGVLDKSYIEHFKKNGLHKSVERHIKKHYLHVSEENLNSDTTPLRGEAFMLVETIESYVRFVLDYDLEIIEKQGNITILECEQKHLMMPLTIGGESFNFSYTPDRIDRLADGTVRIVDYKTGKDETAFVNRDRLDDLFNNTKKDRRKAILQIFLYCYAYMVEHPEVKSVTPVIYKLSSMKDSGVKMKEDRRGAQAEQFVFSMDNPVVQVFAERMGEVVKSLYEEDFIQTPDDAKWCNFCRFVDLCRRTPSKSW